MTSSAPTLETLTAARRAAWLVLLVGFGFQLLTYAGYLCMHQGWLDGLIASGIYGDISRDDLARATFMFVAALKLMNIAILMTALFFTFWVRELRRP